MPEVCSKSKHGSENTAQEKCNGLGHRTLHLTSRNVLAPLTVTRSNRGRNIFGRFYSVSMGKTTRGRKMQRDGHET